MQMLIKMELPHLRKKCLKAKRRSLMETIGNLYSLNVYSLIKFGKLLGVICFDWEKEEDPAQVFRNELDVALKYFGTYILKKRGGIGLGGAHTIITVPET